MVAHTPDAAAPTPSFTRLTSDSGLTTDPAFSPDGKLVAYASDRAGEGDLDIWRQQLATGEAVALTSDPADESEPAFSPDGSRIAFRSERDGGGIYVVSAFGGEPRLIAKHGRRPRFSPDGNHIAYWVGHFYVGKVFVVPTAGGVPMPSSQNSRLRFIRFGRQTESCCSWGPAIPRTSRQMLSTGGSPRRLAAERSRQGPPTY